MTTFIIIIIKILFIKIIILILFQMKIKKYMGQIIIWIIVLIMSNNINNKQNQNIENNNNNYDKDNTQQKGEEKDIIDELIEKIRTNQQITSRESSKDSLNRLDEEVKLGLERLNELVQSQNTYLECKDNKNKNKIGKIRVKNRKFTDLLKEINKTLNDTNNKTYYKRNHYYDYFKEENNDENIRNVQLLHYN